MKAGRIEWPFGTQLDPSINLKKKTKKKPLPANIHLNVLETALQWSFHVRNLRKTHDINQTCEKGTLLSNSSGTFVQIVMAIALLQSRRLQISLNFYSNHFQLFQLSFSFEIWLSVLEFLGELIQIFHIIWLLGNF